MSMELSYIHTRLDKLENDFRYKDICVYFCMVYIIYVICKELNNLT